jgi:hypothetical protein
MGAILKEEQNRLKEFQGNLNSKYSAKEILDCWQFANLLTPKKKQKLIDGWYLPEAKEFIIRRYVDKQGRGLQQYHSQLLAVEKAPDLDSATISVEWKDSRTWGKNPTAEVWATDGRFLSRSIIGCGFDKHSTAIAEALNQSASFLKVLYDYKERKGAKKSNRDVFGYGAGYGVLPSLEGGVGVSCYPHILAKCGYKFSTPSSGKNYDSHQITKGKK